jgi:hypothetical protein
MYADIIQATMDNPRLVLAPEEDEEFQRYIKAKL